MVVGTIEHSASSEIIEKRCHKVVAIFSKAFLESQQNVFLVDLAQYVNIRKKSSLLIPITLEQCDLPTTVAQLFKLKYEKSRVANFYQRFYSIFGIKDASPELLEYPEDMTLGKDSFLPFKKNHNSNNSSSTFRFKPNSYSDRSKWGD